MFSQGSPHVRPALAARRLHRAILLVVVAALVGGVAVPCLAEPFPAAALPGDDSDFVHIGVERPDGVMEFNITSGLVTRTIDLTTWMTGPPNQGLEALTFVPDDADPEGGLFYAGLQTDGKIYTFRLPIASSTTSTAVTHVSTITPVAGRDDLSGLHFDLGCISTSSISGCMPCLTVTTRFVRWMPMAPC